MGKKAFINPKEASSYALVHKSVEDPTYEDEHTARTMVHVGKSGRKRTGGTARDILREDMQYNYDMQNPDDEDADGLFDDQQMEDFDQDFIQQMMDAPEGEEEEEEVDEYPKHETKGNDADAEFAALMKTDYKARDMEIEEHDPRTEGLMPVDAYVPAMQDFVRDGDKGHFLEADRNKEDYLHRLEATGEEVFHQTEFGGKYYTAIRSKRDVDIIDDYHEGMNEARRLVLERLKAEEKAKAERGEEDDDDGEPKYEYVTVKKEAERFDCQTIISTYSNLENHPTVLAAEKGRIRINKRTGQLVRQNKLTSKNLGKIEEETTAEKLGRHGEVAEPEAGSAPSSGDAEMEGSDGDAGESLVTVIDTNAKRPREETAEEKKARKRAVKDEKRMKREEKKVLKTAYRAETVRQRHVNPAAKQQKAMLSLR